MFSFTSKRYYNGSVLQHFSAWEKPPVTLDSCRGELSELILELKSITALATTPDTLNELDACQRFHLMSFMERRADELETVFNALEFCLEAETRERYIS